jgi:hypothetical protein
MTSLEGKNLVVLDSVSKFGINQLEEYYLLLLLLDSLKNIPNID